MADFGVGDGGQGDPPQQYTDEAVAEFLKERQERIAVRRARIGDKIAKRNETQSEGSDVSSLDFIGGGDDTRPGTGVSGASRGSSGRKRGTGGGGVGGSQTKLRDGKKDDNSGQGGGAELLDLKRNTLDPLDVQIDESRKQLEQIILDGETLITNVRVAAENRERVRHVKQAETRKDRLERLQKEADECQEMYDELKPNWNISAKKTLPMDLFEKIKAQMQASEELLMKKQDLISSLQQEIEDNDFEYEQSLEIYQKDVSLMGDRIDDCVDDMQSAFLNELNLIEDYTCRNREVFLEENQREWMDLLGDFQKMEESHLEDRKEDAIDKFKNLNELYITVKQECRAMRHRFEDDLRILIQELEQIKYATQLNMEKLQYNLAIVRKRYKENVEMKNMMKRLLLSFNDRFTNKSRALKQKMEAGKKEAKKILADIAKLEESLSQFGRKTLHLAISDWGKYMDMWMVSEESVRERVKKLLDSEKFIFETQLGFTNAIIPEMTFMDDRPEVVSKYIMKKSSAYAALLQQNPRQSTASTSNLKKSKASEDLSVGEMSEPKTSDSCKKSDSLLLLPSDSIEFIPGPEPDPAIQRRLMKHVAKVICDESGFLVEEELRKLLDPLKETERNLVNLDALLKALGINTIAEMQYLAHFMLRRCRVTKGVISRIESKESAHLSEMNVSLEGIVGKNALDDVDSDEGSSVRSKSLTADPMSEGRRSGKEDELSHGSTEFKECQCDVGQSLESDEIDEEPAKEKEEKTLDPLGETTVEILLPPVSRGESPDDDDDGECALIPELKGVDEQQLDFGNFTQSQVQCTPKCCSLGGSEEAIEEAVVELEDDDELEDILDEADEEEDDDDEEEGDEEEDEDEEVERVPSKKCSTCGGEPHDHQDCSFISSEATVLSWADPHDPPNRALREALHRMDAEEDAEPEEIIPLSTLPTQLLETAAEVEISEVPSTMDEEVQSSILETELSERKTTGEDATLEILRLEPPPPLTLEGYGDPVRAFDEFQPAPITAGDQSAAIGDRSTAQTTTADTDQPFGRTDSGESESLDTETIASMDSSSNGSVEFMYIEPDEVIDALNEFCKDYNARITVELPTVDEIIDRKLIAFKYPKQTTVLEYWERPMKILTSNSDDMWETMQYCFEQFNDALKKRNNMVDKFISLYKQNQELGVLMKNHFAAAGRYASSRPNRNPGFMHYGRFCDQ